MVPPTIAAAITPEILEAATTEANQQLSAARKVLFLARHFVHEMQAYSIPLLMGIVASLVWANVANDSYEYAMNEWEPFPGFEILQHKVTIKFLVNDIFMVFFFGLAAKEVTEACLREVHSTLHARRSPPHRHRRRRPRADLHLRPCPRFASACPPFLRRL